MEPSTTAAEPQFAPLEPEAVRSDGGPTARVAGLELVSGRTMRSALLEARRAFGDKAVVIGQRTVAGGCTIAVSTVIPRSTDDLAAMRADATRLLTPTPQAPRPPAEKPRSPLADVEKRLREHGASKKFRERVLEVVAAREDDGTHPLDAAAEVVAKSLDVATLPVDPGRPTVVGFVGQSGVGKSTTLAKLALRLARAGRRVLLATYDGANPTTSRSLQRMGEQLRLPVAVSEDAHRLSEDLARMAGRFDVVMLDGSGQPERDAAALRTIKARANAADAPYRLAPLAVLAATSSAASQQVVTSAIEDLEPTGAIVTKLDESGEPFAVLEHAASCRLAIAFMTNGPDMGPHFHRASGERFADVALIGRIA